MSERKTYEVTELAPPRIGDKRVQAGDKIDLTDREARYELLRGTVKQVETPAPNEERAPTRGRRSRA